MIRILLLLCCLFPAALWGQFTSQGYIIPSGVDTTGRVVNDSLFIRSVAGIDIDTSIIRVEGIDVLKNNLLPDYATLRSTVGGELPSVIVVEDFTYDFQGTSYTTKGGTFYKWFSGSEDGGTIVVANDGTKWKRDWDGVNAFSEWWVMGGFDQNGIDFIDNSVSSAGIGAEDDRISAAISVGEKISLQNRTYITRRSINWTESLGALDIEGNGAVIKQGVMGRSALVANVSPGALTISVADAKQFRVRDRIRILDVSAPNGGKGNSQTEASYLDLMLINSIDTINNTLDISGDGVDDSFDIGDLVVQENAMFEGPVNFRQLSVRDLVWDQNRTENDLSYAWEYYHLFAPGDGEMLHVENVIFREGISTMVFASKGVFVNCEFRSSNGPGIHLGAGPVGDGDEHGTGFVNCKFIRVNEKANGSSLGQANHSEADITFSVVVAPISVTDCEFFGVGTGAIFSPVSATDTMYIHISKTYAENYSSIFLQTTSTTDIEYERIDISDSYFVDCGDTKANGRNLQTGLGISRFSFEDNYFINCRFYFEDVGQFTFRNNWQVTDTTTQYYRAWEGRIENVRGFLNIVRFDQVIIEGCHISTTTANDPHNQIGIYITDVASRTRDDGGSLTDYYYGQRVKISNNTIANFARGISDDADVQWAGNELYQYVGHEYTDNSIYVTKDETITRFGIEVNPGVIAEQNKIYMAGSGGYGLIIRGIDGSAKDVTGLLGGIGLNNWIYREPGNIAILLGTTSGSVTADNLICSNNWYQGTVFNLMDSGLFTDNKELNLLIPTYSAPTVPTYHEWKENIELY